MTAGSWSLPSCVSLTEISASSPSSSIRSRSLQVVARGLRGLREVGRVLAEPRERSRDAHVAGHPLRGLDGVLGRLAGHEARDRALARRAAGELLAERGVLRCPQQQSLDRVHRPSIVPGRTEPPSGRPDGTDLGCPLGLKPRGSSAAVGQATASAPVRVQGRALVPASDRVEGQVMGQAPGRGPGRARVQGLGRAAPAAGAGAWSCPRTRLGACGRGGRRTSSLEERFIECRSTIGDPILGRGSSRHSRVAAALTWGLKHVRVWPFVLPARSGRVVDGKHRCARRVFADPSGPVHRVDSGVAGRHAPSEYVLAARRAHGPAPPWCLDPGKR